MSKLISALVLATMVAVMTVTAAFADPSEVGMAHGITNACSQTQSAAAAHTHCGFSAG